jgi:hypothetical protein
MLQSKVFESSASSVSLFLLEWFLIAIHRIRICLLARLLPFRLVRLEFLYICFQPSWRVFGNTLAYLMLHVILHAWVHVSFTKRAIFSVVAKRPLVCSHRWRLYNIAAAALSALFAVFSSWLHAAARNNNMIYWARPTLLLPAWGKKRKRNTNERERERKRERERENEGDN